MGGEKQWGGGATFYDPDSDLPTTDFHPLYYWI